MEGQAQVRLVFAGEILEGFQADEVKRRFGEAFKVEGAKLAAMFSGTRTVLKRSLAHADALRYVAQLQRMGVRVLVEPVDVAAGAVPAAPALAPISASAAAPAPASLAPTAPAATAIAAPVPAAPRLALADDEIVCPNCSERQSKRVLCRACSTDMPRGIAAKKEDADRARAERQAARESRWAPPRSTGGEVSSGSVVDAPPMLSLSFEGRMGRISYINAGGLAWAGLAAIGIVAAVLLPMTRSALAFIPLGLGFLVFLIWAIRVSVLRLHDFNRSGWWVLLTAVPYLGALVSLALVFIPGSADDNDYGDKPRQGNAIVACVILVVGLIGLVVLGSISMSAYNDYSKRAARAEGNQGKAPQAAQEAAQYISSPAALEAFSAYAAEASHKAFAASGSGAWGWRSGQTSPREAVAKAMAVCEENRKPYTSECELVNVNGAWVDQRQ